MNDPFPTTSWSAVQYESSQGSEAARRALTVLYENYWAPLYAYLRRRGLDSESAEDVLQAFYLRLFERNVVSNLDRERGLLRAFLLAALKNFLLDHRNREKARVRKPEGPVLSLDVLAEESHYQAISSSDRTPEEVFELRWASTVAARARQSLILRERAAGNEDSFAQLEAHVFGGSRGAPYRQLADSFGISVSAVKLRVHRYRKRLGQLLREEIERTVTDASSVDPELRHLLQRLSETGT